MPQPPGAPERPSRRSHEASHMTHVLWCRHGRVWGRPFHPCAQGALSHTTTSHYRSVWPLGPGAPSKEPTAVPSVAASE